MCTTNSAIKKNKSGNNNSGINSHDALIENRIINDKYENENALKNIYNGK